MGKGEIKISENIRTIREQSKLTRLVSEDPEIETWLNQEYTDHDIEDELRKLETRKAHGSDGIPGDAYKTARKWAHALTSKIMNDVKIDQKYQKDGLMEPLYTYKNNGYHIARGTYRPICITQIIYKIGS